MADSKRSELGGAQGSVFDDPGAIRMFSVRCIWEPAFCLRYDRLIVHCLEAFTTGHTGRDLVRAFIFAVGVEIWRHSNVLGEMYMGASLLFGI